jgi:hypothetical protein
VQEAEREEQLARAARAEATANQQTQLAAATPQPAPPVANPAVKSSPVSTSTASNPAVVTPAPSTAEQISVAEEPNYIPAPRALLPKVASPDSNPSMSSRGAAKTAAFNNAPLPKAMPTSTTNLIAASAASAATLHFMPNELRMRRGERRQITLMLDSEAPINMLVAMLKFDPKVIAVRNVISGNFAVGQGAAPVLTSSINPQGSLLASLVTPDRSALLRRGAGVLMMLEIEALTTGESFFNLDSEDIHFVASDNRTITKQLTPGRVIVVQ